jgi:hypothetical protein
LNRRRKLFNTLLDVKDDLIARSDKLVTNRGALACPAVTGDQQAREPDP